MLTKELQETLHRAAQQAQQERHEYITLEHLLGALLDEKTGSDIISNCGGDIPALKRDLQQFMDENYGVVPKRVEHNPDHGPALERVLQRAFLQAQGSAQTTLDSGNILAAMFEERRSYAVYILKKARNR